MTPFVMPTVPSAPEELDYTATDASTINLKWEKPDDASRGITKYEILFTLDDQAPLAQWQVREVDGETGKGSVSLASGLVD